MDHNTAVEKLVESLSFEVEAVPQENVTQYKSTSHITPVNVKVRVRKKDKSGVQKGTICIPKVARTEYHTERIRLASSDQTIMSFNVLMEDSDNIKSKNKNVFGSCLGGTTDDDDGPYMPKEEASGSKSRQKQKLALSKTAGNQFAPGDVGRKPKKLFGPCKPGGCLDPPFGEDRYSYLPPDTKSPKRPSTDNKVNTKTKSPSTENKVDRETKRPSTDNKIDSETKQPSSDDKEHLETKHPSTDNNVDTDKKYPSNDNQRTDKKPERCPKKDESQTCPSFGYRVDPAKGPFPFDGCSLGNAPENSEEGPDSFKENETINNKRKRKGSKSDSVSTVIISKITSGTSNSMQSLFKEKRTESALEDKESNSIITYAGDEDDVDNERLNKNRKSSVNTNRTSFDLNAPYYSPPKKEIHKDLNEKTEKLRRSFEPLGKPQNGNNSDDKDGLQKNLLRMGIDLQGEDTVNIEEIGHSQKTEDNFTNTKNVKRPSTQESQNKRKDEANIDFPLDNPQNKVNSSSVDFLDSFDDFDNIGPKSYDKDQGKTVSKKSDGAIEKTYVAVPLHIRENEIKDNGVVFVDSSDNYDNIKPKAYDKYEVENIPQQSTEGIEKYKTDDMRTVSHNNTKDYDKQINNFPMSKQSNTYFSGFETENEDGFYSKPTINAEDLKDNSESGILEQDINLQKDLYIKQTDFSKEIIKPGLQSDKDKDYLGHETSFKDNTNTLQPTDTENLKAGYIENTIDSKSQDVNTKDKRYSFEKFDNTDIVTLKPGTFYKEISDAESDYKITESRSSIMNKKYDTKYNTALVQAATDMDLSSLTKTPITKIDINSKEKLHDSGNTMSNFHRVASMTSKYLNGDRFELVSANSKNQDTGTRQYDDLSIKTGMGSSKDTEIRNDDKMLSKTGKNPNKLVRDIPLDLAFQNSFDGSERVLKTLEPPLDLKLQADPNIFVIQKRISLDGETIRVLIDPDTDMTIQINSHSIDNNQGKDNNIHEGILISDNSHHHQNIHPHVTFSSEHLHKNLSYLYEKELVPLQNMIKDLKAEIDALARQHKRREKAAQLNRRLKPVKQCSGIVIKK